MIDIEEMEVPKEEVQYLVCELVFNSLDDRQGDVFDATKQLIEIIMDAIPKEKREEMGKEILEDLITHCDDFDEIEEGVTHIHNYLVGDSYARPDDNYVIDLWKYYSKRKKACTQNYVI